MTRYPLTMCAVCAFGVALIGTLPVHGQEDPNPYQQPQGSWITLSGTVAASTDSSFTLDYGAGLVTVEMDDWDWYADGNRIIEDDKVTVRGRVDDDLYDLTSVDASSVYVEGLNTYFYANPSDEDRLGGAWSSSDRSQVHVVGDVTSVEGREFTVEMGDQTLTVDTGDMSYNPLDEIGYQQVEVGDRVRVEGNIEDAFFNGRELVADTVITLMQDPGKAEAMNAETKN